MINTAYDLDAFRGCTFRIQVGYQNPDGSLINLSTGYTAKMVIGDGASALTLTGGSGLTLGNGTIDVVVTAAQTKAFEAGTYPYDLTITATGGDTILLLRGNFYNNRVLST